jgi:Transposase, Mutator family/short chain dehydrogenase
LAIDVLINNTGLSGNTAFADASWDTLAAELQIMTTAPTHLSHLVAPGMRARGWGRIVNVASIAALLPPPASLLYTPIKRYVLDLARAMLQTFAETLMSAQASMLREAGDGERTDERVNTRNGYRHRPWDTRVGSIDLAIPKLREGTYYPDWLLQPRRRADDLVKAMGIDGISKSQVSRMAAELGRAGGSLDRRGELSTSGDDIHGGQAHRPRP